MISLTEKKVVLYADAKQRPLFDFQAWYVGISGVKSGMHIRLVWFNQNKAHTHLTQPRPSEYLLEVEVFSHKESSKEEWSP